MSFGYTFEIDTSELDKYASHLNNISERLRNETIPQKIRNCLYEIRNKAANKAPRLTGRLISTLRRSPVTLIDNSTGMLSIYVSKEDQDFNYAALVERPPIGAHNRKGGPVKGNGPWFSSLPINKFQRPWFLRDSIIEVMPSFRKKLLDETTKQLKGE